MKKIEYRKKSVFIWLKAFQVFSLFLSIIVLFSGNLVLANATKVCDDSIELVARSTTVPKDILYKIARLESGRYLDGQFVSWPWSLNNAGDSYVLDSFEEGLKKLVRLHDGGESNVDIGCMQLNLRWHGSAFNNLSAMLSPLKNVTYASTYLEKLFAETGSWEQAVKYYHSRNPKYNEVYFSKFQEIKIPSVPVNSDYGLFAYFGGKLPSVINLFSNQSRQIIQRDTKPNINYGALYGQSGPSFENIRDFRVAPLVEM